MEPSLTPRGAFGFPRRIAGSTRAGRHLTLRLGARPGALATSDKQPNCLTYAIRSRIGNRMIPRVVLSHSSAARSSARNQCLPLP
jgi:hypothetical protein